MTTTTNVFLDGEAVDRALEQTRQLFTYAAMPLPLWELWLLYAGDNGTRFQYQLTCGLPGYDFSQAQVDEAGDIRWCMKEPDHCGHGG